MSSVSRDLIENGYALLPAFPEPSLLTEAFKGMRRLADEPAHYRNVWARNRAVENTPQTPDWHKYRKDDHGFRRREPDPLNPQDTTDPKSIGMFRLTVDNRLDVFDYLRDKKVDFKRYVEFLEVCQAIYFRAYEQMEKVYYHLVETGVCQPNLLRGMREYHALRLVLYDPVKSGRPVADVHRDEAALTLAFHERPSGLALYPLDRPEGILSSSLGKQSVLFPGRRIGLASDHQLISMKHGVSDKVVEPGVYREAAIFFLHLAVPLETDEEIDHWESKKAELVMVK